MPSSLCKALLVNQAFLSFTLALALVGCGSDSPVSQTPSDPETEDNTNLIFSTDIVIPLNERISLIPSTNLGTTEFDAISPSDFVIAWTGLDHLENTQGKFLAQSHSGVPVTLDPCAIPEEGDHGLIASVYAPFDTELLDPIFSQEVTIKIDPGCYTLKFEERPETFINTNDGLTEAFRVQVRIEDHEGNLFTDDAGNRPPVEIEVDISSGVDNAVVSPVEGTTNSNGYFRGEVTLTKNLAIISVRVRATYTDPDSGFQLRDHAYFFVQDPCNSNDSEEREYCPPDPTPPPDDPDEPSCSDICGGGCGCCYSCNLFGRRIWDE